MAEYAPHALPLFPGLRELICCVWRVTFGLVLAAPRVGRVSGWSWDPTHCHHSIQLSAQNTTASSAGSDGQWGTVLGATEMKRGVWEWEVVLEEYNTSSGWNVVVGVTPANSSNFRADTVCGTSATAQGWGIITGTGTASTLLKLEHASASSLRFFWSLPPLRLCCFLLLLLLIAGQRVSHAENGGAEEEYATPMRAGDVVKLRLELNASAPTAGILSVSINGRSYGVCPLLWTRLCLILLVCVLCVCVKEMFRGITGPVKPFLCVSYTQRVVLRFPKAK